MTNAESSLRRLRLEDDPEDATLVKSTLEAEGIACTVMGAVDNDVENGPIELTWKTRNQRQGWVEVSLQVGHIV